MSGLDERQSLLLLPAEVRWPPDGHLFSEKGDLEELLRPRNGFKWGDYIQKKEACGSFDESEISRTEVVEARIK